MGSKGQTRTGVVIGVLFMMMLSACASAPVEGPEQSLSVDEFFEELVDPGKYVDVFCADLKSGQRDRKDVPAVTQCNEDSDPDTNQRGVVVGFEDQVTHLVDNGIKLTEDNVFAPLEALAEAYDFVGADALAPFVLYLVFFKDECGTVWEVEPATLAKVAAKSVTPLTAMEEVGIYATPNCP